MSGPTAHESGKNRDKFIMIPNLVDDLPLSAGAFRLYVHIKRVTGEDGECWQGQRELERRCRLGNRTVVRAKQELIAVGLIECNLRMVKGHIGHVIKPLDIWDKNESAAVNNDTRDSKEHARCITTELRCKTTLDCGVNQHPIAVNNSTSKNTPEENPLEENSYEENPVGAQRPFSREFIKDKYGHFASDNGGKNEKNN